MPSSQSCRKPACQQAGSPLKGRGLTPFPLQGKGAGGWGEVSKHTLHDFIISKGSLYNLGRLALWNAKH
jgi:hypothetical protein